jgi:hypothetical protein
VTRLIEADAIPYVTDETYLHEFDYAYRYAIDALPTVEAVPIEYMQSQLDCGKWAEIIQRWKEHEQADKR